MREKEAELSKKSRQKVENDEKNGTRMKYILTKSDPYGDKLYERKYVLNVDIRREANRQVQKKQHCIRIRCKKCEAAVGKAEYFCEPSRSGFCRGPEHTKDLIYLNSTSSLVKHIMKHHSDIDLTKETKRHASDHLIRGQKFHKNYFEWLKRPIWEKSKHKKTKYITKILGFTHLKNLTALYHPHRPKQIALTHYVQKFWQLLSLYCLNFFLKIH